MKKLRILTAAALMLSLAGPALATNGYQLTGVGEKQTAMGGAVTAAPMDAMTAITNPAGMARIGSRADFSMEAFMPKRSVDFSGNGGGKTEGGSELYGIPSLGWTAPAFGRDDVFFGGGMFVTSGLGVDYGEVTYMPGAALGLANDVTFNGYSAIQFWKMAPTVAWNVNESLSLGVALNLDYQSVTMTQKLRNVPFWNDPTNHAAGMTQMDVNFDLGRPTSQLGYGASIGVLYDPTKWLTIGASYTTKQYFANAEYRVGTNDIFNYNGALGMAGTYKLDMEYPQQAAFGIALHPSTMILVTADVKWINWKDTHDEVSLTGPNGSFDLDGNPMNGGETNKTKLAFDWEDQWVYAVGLQVAPTDRLKFRAGYNYSKSPIGKEDVFNNLIFPAIVEQHASMGVDYMLGDHWGVALTYMKAFKESMKGENDVPVGFQVNAPFSANSGSKISLEEDSVGMQLTYVF